MASRALGMPRKDSAGGLRIWSSRVNPQKNGRSRCRCGGHELSDFLIHASPRYTRTTIPRTRGSRFNEPMALSLHESPVGAEVSSPRTPLTGDGTLGSRAVAVGRSNGRKRRGAADTA